MIYVVLSVSSCCEKRTAKGIFSLLDVYMARLWFQKICFTNASLMDHHKESCPNTQLDKDIFLAK